MKCRASLSRCCSGFGRRSWIASLNDLGIEEIAGQVRTLAEKVEVQQTSLAQTIEAAVTAQLTIANESFNAEQRRATTLVEQLCVDISQVAHGKLEEIPALLFKHEAEYKVSHAAF